MAKKVNVYNLEGEVTGSITLPKVFETEANAQLLSQYVRVYLANNRQGTRDTKDRSEVSGKARKPYKQKGTGHARHGSLKAPSMKGGGIAHGPKPANFSLKMSKIMRKRALESAYGMKAEECIVLESADLTEAKTKNLVNFLDKAEIDNKVLFITSDVQKNLVLSARNIPGVEVKVWDKVNAYDVLNSGKVVLEKNVIESLENKLGK